MASAVIRFLGRFAPSLVRAATRGAKGAKYVRRIGQAAHHARRAGATLEALREGGDVLSELSEGFKRRWDRVDSRYLAGASDAAHVLGGLDAGLDSRRLRRDRQSGHGRPYEGDTRDLGGGLSRREGQQLAIARDSHPEARTRAIARARLEDSRRERKHERGWVDIGEHGREARRDRSGWHFDLGSRSWRHASGQDRESRTERHRARPYPSDRSFDREAFLEDQGWGARRGGRVREGRGRRR